MKNRQSFHVKDVCKMSKINMYKMYVCTFWSQLSKCYASYIVPNRVRGFIIPCLKLIGQFYLPKLIKQKAKNSYA